MSLTSSHHASCPPVFTEELHYQGLHSLLSMKEALCDWALFILVIY